MSSYAERYLSSRGFEDILVKYRHQKVRGLLLKLLGQTKNRCVLEVGVGADLLLDTIAGIEYAQWTIVEPEQKFLDLIGSQKKLHVCCEYFDSQSVDKKYRGYYDIIILSCILHEVDYRDMILEANQNLSDNGFLIVVNPNINSMHRQIALNAGLINSLSEHSARSKFLDQVGMIAEQYLLHEIEKYRLTLLDVKGNFVKPFTHDQMQRLSTWPEFSDILDGLNNLSDVYPDISSELIYVFQKECI